MSILTTAATVADCPPSVVAIICIAVVSCMAGLFVGYQVGYSNGNQGRG